MAKPTERQILDRLEKMVKDIKKGNGFYNTIKQVNQIPKSPEQMNNNLPGTNVLIGDIDYKTAIRNEAGALKKTTPFVFDTVFKARDEARKVEIGTELVADFDLRFGDDTPAGNTSYNLSKPAYNLEGLVITVEPVSAIIRDIEGYDMSLLRYTIWVGYWQNRKNPNQFFNGAS